MGNLFLTSSVNGVAHDIAKKLDLSTKNKLVFITTAAEQKTSDKTWEEEDRQSLIDAGFKVTDYTITEKNLDQLKADLKDYDYIYLSGGSTPYLIKKSHESGFFDVIHDLINKDGKTYIGTSAGSIIAGPKCPDYLEEDGYPLEDPKGYGFVNFTVLPHWGSDNHKTKYLDGRLDTAYKNDQVPLVLLTNSQYVHVQGGKCEFVEVTK